MKKITLAAMTAMMLAPSTSFAEGWTKEVTSAAELSAAFKSIGSGVSGEIYEIICNWEPGKTESVNDLKPSMTAGTLYIHSNETDFSKMPSLQIAMTWQEDMKERKEMGKNMSVIIENLNIKGYKSYLIDHRKVLYGDTIRLKRCDIDGTVRSVLRLDGNSNPENLLVDVIEVKECVIHNTAQASGDNWSIFRAFMPVNILTFENNLFYDAPYTKSILETRTPADVASTVNFNNNMVLLGENKEISTAGFTVLMTGATLSAGTTFNLNNNLFIGPKKGYNTLHNYSSTYVNTKITNASDVIIFANNNVIDTESYQTFEQLQETLAENNVVIIPNNNYALTDYADFSWEAGKTFQEAEKNMYYILNSNPWKTAGYDYENEGGEYYVGPSVVYVDEFPTPASITVNINGPSYITYTVSPDKDQYYLNDEVTITLKNHNSLYRTFNTFKGWSDSGSTDLTRTVILDGDVNLTASFENDNSVVCAFDFSNITGNTTIASYDADIYFDMNDTYKATVKAIVCDTATSKVAPVPYIEGNFQGRANKFGEDDVELQMPIISRRTAKDVKEIQRDYALIEFSTKGLSDVKVSAYVGTDNNAATTQKIDWSLDNTTWNPLTSTDLTDTYVWQELEGTLPAEANNKDKVYLRIIGDPASGHIVDGIGCTEDTYATTDAFEYIGNILITANTEGAETGIVSVSSDSKTLNENAPIYNMMGMKVAKGTKGLLIQNGKKFIVK